MRKPLPLSPKAGSTKTYGMPPPWKRRVGIASAILLVSFLVAFVPAIRTYVLRSAGRALVLGQHSTTRADIIIVAIDADGAGVLEAADLVAKGVAARVAVFADPPSHVDREFLRRGLPYADAAATSVRQLQMLGVSDIDRIERTVAGTEEEGELLPAWCDQRHYRSVVVVTLTDHSRRLNRILRRSMKGHTTSFTVQSSRYSHFDPDAWWQTREGARTEIVEFQKLLLDLLQHPFS